MKKITLDDIKDIYRKILDGSLSREDAHSVAGDIMKNEECKVLIFWPENEESVIREEVEFLFGIDLPGDIKPGEKVEYLYGDQEIKERFELLI